MTGVSVRVISSILKKYDFFLEIFTELHHWNSEVVVLLLRQSNGRFIDTPELYSYPALSV
jgi:hypothetical protein